MGKIISEESIATVPATFRKISERLIKSLERRLGYFGDGRFMFFYYEPRGEEVIWNDGGSYGFSCGGWGIFMEQIAPLAARYGVNVGSIQSENTHVLVIDRMTQAAYFAQEWEAEQFLSLQKCREAA